MQRAAWTQGGQHLEFHAHADAGGMGSSLISDSVYREGYCDGNVTCTKSQALFFFLLCGWCSTCASHKSHKRSWKNSSSLVCFYVSFCFCFFRTRPIQREVYQVLTVDVRELILAVAEPEDYLVLRMDIEGAEYDVARHLVTGALGGWGGCVACLVDHWLVGCVDACENSTSPNTHTHKHTHTHTHTHTRIHTHTNICVWMRLMRMRIVHCPNTAPSPPPPPPHTHTNTHTHVYRCVCI
jgi:hypothetical protein